MLAQQRLTLLKTFVNRSIGHPYITTLVLCLFGAMIKIALVNYPLSSDGALYLTVARVFSQEGFEAAQAVYYYSFLSILISFVSSVTSLSLLHAGQLVCVGLAALGSLSFVYIVRQHDKGWATTLAAILLIVLLPQFNELKEQIYRDFGLWAFTLAAVASLIHFERGAPRWYFLLWFVLQCLAGLFKQEGFVPLLAPFVLAFNVDSRARVFRSPAVLIAGLVIGGAIGVMYYLNRHDLHWTMQYAERLSSIPEHISSQATKLGESILNEYSDRHAYGLYLWMLAVLMLLSLIKAFKTAIIIPVLYLMAKGWRNSSVAPALKVYILLVTLPIVMFCIEYQFVAARYMMVLVLLILAAILPGLIQQWERFPRTARALAIVLSLAFTIESFSVSLSNDAHLKSAEQWLADNVAAEARVFSNARAITFVLDRMDNPLDAMSDWPEHAEFRYDYYLHLTSRKGRSPPPFNTGPAVVSFTAKKGKKVEIFDLRARDVQSEATK